MTDGFWPELERLDARAFARLEPRFGSCPLCRASATGVVTLSTVQWATCDACSVRWVAGEHLLSPVDDSENATLNFQKLAQYAQVERRPDHHTIGLTCPGADARHEPTATRTENSMNTKQPAAEPVDFAATDYDPWPTAYSPDPTTQRISGCPSFWYLLTVPARARLYGLVLHGRAAGRKPSSSSINEILALQKDADDPVARQLLEDMRTPSLPSAGLVEHLVTTIDRAGGAVALLEEQRRQIDHHLAQLRTILQVTQ
jgi:hypothetical protein